MKTSDLLLLAQARDWATSGYARQIRISAGLTQKHVGGHCGVTGTAVAHWEAGTRTVNADRKGERALIENRSTLSLKLLGDLSLVHRLAA